MKIEIRRGWLLLTPEDDKEEQLLNSFHEEHAILQSEGVITSPNKPKKYGYSVYMKGIPKW